MPEIDKKPAVETEAKFIIPDQATFLALQEIDHLADFQFEPQATKQVVDRYLGAKDGHILQAGYACRIRSAGSKKTLTLKSLTPPNQGVHRRQELEIELKGDDPESGVESQTKALIMEIIGPEPLEDLFALHQIRHKRRVLLEGRPVIELSLDEVRLDRAGMNSYFELEAELIEEGDESDLQQFVDTLQNQWALQEQTQSKFERALTIHQAQQAGGGCNSHTPT